MADNYGENPWGIVNNEGKQLTVKYIKTFIMSYCRGDDFQFNRKDNLDFLAGDAFLAPLQGKTIGEVCQAAKTHECWKDPSKVRNISPINTRAKASAKATSDLSIEEGSYIPQLLKIGKIHYRLAKGSAWWTGERRTSVGWQCDEWLMPVTESLESAWEKFQAWAAKDAKRLEDMTNVISG